MVLAYVSAIQDISLSPVLMSGAGTSMPGPGHQRWGGGNYTATYITHITLHYITHSTFCLIEPESLDAHLVSAIRICAVASYTGVLQTDGGGDLHCGQMFHSNFHNSFFSSVNQ